MPSDREHDVAARCGQLVGELHPGGGRPNDEDTAIGQLGRPAVAVGSELVHVSGEVSPRRGHRREGGIAGGEDDGRSRPGAGRADDHVPVITAPNGQHVGVLDDGRRGVSGIPLEDVDELARSEERVRVGCLTEAGQPRRPGRAEQPQAVPPS